MEELIKIILTSLSIAVLSCWIAYQSTIVQKIKAWLYLTPEQKLPKWKTWFKPFGFIFEEIRDLFNCPYCISFHIGWITFIFIVNLPIGLSIILAGLPVFCVDLYRKISL